MVINFNNKFKKISFSQVNLKEFFIFYKNFICPYKYTYILNDENKLVIIFEENNFSHLLGLHKFKKIKSYKYSSDINKDIESNKITLNYLLEKEPFTLTKELRDRMTYFPVLKTLLENTDTALQYDLNVIWNSKIEFSFLLKTNKISILVYLAVKEIKQNKKICVPVSLLVDRNDRFLKMKLKELKIKDIKITKKG